MNEAFLRTPEEKAMKDYEDELILLDVLASGGKDRAKRAERRESTLKAKAKDKNLAESAKVCWEAKNGHVDYPKHSQKKAAKREANRKVRRTNVRACGGGYKKAASVQRNA